MKSQRLNHVIVCVEQEAKKHEPKKRRGGQDPMSYVNNVRLVLLLSQCDISMCKQIVYKTITNKYNIISQSLRNIFYVKIVDVASSVIIYY